MSKLVGYLALSIALLSILFGTLVPPEQTQLLLPLAFIFLASAALAFTFHKRVVLNRKHQRITSFLCFLLCRKQRVFPLKSFHHVGISRGNYSGTGGISSIYFVQLLGEEDLAIPGKSHNLKTVQSNAQEIANYLNLPLDLEPKTTLFNHRLEHQ